MLGVFTRSGQQQQQGQPSPTTQSWYPPSVAGPASSGPTRTPPPPPSNVGGRPSGGSPLSRTSISEVCSTSGGHVPLTTALASSPGPHTSNSAPNFSGSLREKRPEELTLLLNDEDAYSSFLHSLDEVKRLDTISVELEKSIIDESKKNLAKESEIAELRTQCMIVRNTELAATKKQFEEVEQRYMEVQANSSPSAFLHELQVAANEVDEDSENLHRKFLAGEIELLEFTQKYRKQRLLYHRRSLIHMGGIASMSTPG